MRKMNYGDLILICLGIAFGSLIGTLLTSSLSIGLAFGFVSSIAPMIYKQRRADISRRKLQKLWPEILDHIISGLNSGLSLAQTLSALGDRGPTLTRHIFKAFGDAMAAGMTYSNALQIIKISFSDSISDQVCEVLDFARSSGSRDSALTLRTLSTYIRNDLALRNEINAKHGWIKNAAILSALAPWLLLTILATQPSTISAYSSVSGMTILGIGVLLTLIAFFLDGASWTACSLSENFPFG